MGTGASAGLFSNRGAEVEKTELRAMSLQQLSDFAASCWEFLATNTVMDVAAEEYNCGRILRTNANMYHLNTHFIMPLSKPFLCSFMELVSTGEQPPHWFISHWWGTPFADTVEMLEFHAKSRHLKMSTFYWMCTFANNQHNLAELSQDDIIHTPFAKALLMDHCAGTIVLMPEGEPVPFTRIWCVFEDYISLKIAKEKKESHLFDVATIIPAQTQEYKTGYWNMRCRGLVLDNGCGTFVDQGGDTCDGAWFPVAISTAGVEVDIEKAEATQKQDKTDIMRLIGKDVQSVNRSLHQKFAPLACYNWACTSHADPDALEWLLKSGMLGENKENIARAINGQAAVPDACEYLTDEEVDEALKLLLDAHADPDVRNEEGYTGLYLAAVTYSGGNMKHVKMLLEARADPNLPYKPKKDETILEKAKDKNVLKVLKEYGYVYERGI